MEEKTDKKINKSTDKKNKKQLKNTFSNMDKVELVAALEDTLKVVERLEIQLDENKKLFEQVL